ITIPPPTTSTLFPYTTLFRSNGASGVVTIQNGRNFNPSGTFNNAGLVNIGANSTFTLSNGGTSTGDWDVDALGALNVSTASYLRSEEHTSELQSQSNLVCRLL